MVPVQRRSSASHHRRDAGARRARLHAVGNDGDRHLPTPGGSPARAMQRQLVHRWDRGVADDMFDARYSLATRVTVMLGSASLLWVGLVVAVRLALG